MRGQRGGKCTHASGVLRALSPHRLMRFKKTHMHPQLKTRLQNIRLGNVEMFQDT